ncbi:unnamed protein product [Angiostrongylus costaricensis]|uniref:Transmembrane protein n=1 Tax=Angiostrongylus costaricensis TaxID=334426 RepID=A0A0R3PXV0_ANGCS|nr:unnamed protein product [Angiostrongylus costaricensis]
MLKENPRPISEAIFIDEHNVISGVMILVIVGGARRDDCDGVDGDNDAVMTTEDEKSHWCILSCRILQFSTLNHLWKLRDGILEMCISHKHP